MDKAGRSMRNALLASGLLLAGLASASVLAQEEWMDDLKQQAMMSKRCEVGFMTDVKVRTVDGQKAIFARIHCHDGRVFDASRVGDFGQFAFAACDVKSC